MGFDGTADTCQHLLAVEMEDGKAVPAASGNGQALRRSGCGGNVGDEVRGWCVKINARRGEGRRQGRRKNANLRGSVMAIAAIAVDFAQIGIVVLGVPVGIYFMRMMAEVRACHRRIMLAIRRRHRPTGLVRQNGKQENEDETFHA